MGVRRFLLEWLHSFLKQRVVINGTVSGWAVVGSGIPQGAVLAQDRALRNTDEPNTDAMKSTGPKTLGASAFHRICE